MSDLIKISGLSGNELRYLISKNKIEHKIIRTRKYFSKNDITTILIQGKKFYPYTKNQKTYVDQNYKIENSVFFTSTRKVTNFPNFFAKIALFILTEPSKKL